VPQVGCGLASHVVIQLPVPISSGAAQAGFIRAEARRTAADRLRILSMFSFVD
jgi:hypothetical protein